MSRYHQVSDESKRAKFEALTAEAAMCTRCPAMCERTAVLSELNGSVASRIMFIGEAPGRKGADRTRVPFSGDQSGKNFDRFLAAIGLSREHIFITSAALCNPRTESGANRKPGKTELTNCSNFLRRTLELVNPVFVVTLGSVALDALKSIQPHTLSLRESVARVHSWDGRVLVPLYHPSPQVLASHRREAEQLSDYRVVADAIKLAGEGLRGFAARCAERLAFPDASTKCWGCAPKERRSLQIEYGTLTERHSLSAHRTAKPRIRFHD